MKKVLILGSTGMLGNSVGKVMEQEPNIQPIMTYRNESVSYGDNRVFFDATQTPLSSLPECDYIINCIGIIKPFIDKNKKNSVYINSVFPYELAEHCKIRNIKLIHITTDCVFSGKEGGYNEESPHDCLDFYGKSKSLGEPHDQCMVIRTSIIGEEIHNNASLIEWVKSMNGKKIKGFTDHLWNGVTTKQYGELCSTVIKENLYEKGLFHVHSDTINKYELVSMIASRFNLNIEIEPTPSGNFCDRTLATTKPLNEKLKVPNLIDQITNL